MRSDRERLLDIQEAIARIERYLAGGRRSLSADEVLQQAVLRHLQIIGEAVRALSAELKEKHPEVPWAKIVGMRHVLVHNYFDIDEEVVTEVVKHDLPDLERKVAAILRELGSSEAEI
jgi:uncharacterized protein with HEPN domain